jgi:pimeloyl-ACP methyl ester carboxylesterase
MILERPDGARIFYKLTGKDSGRPPLVLVHGWCSRHEIWEQQVRHFGKRHRILLLDRRGQGRSTTSGSGHNVQGHAGDIAAVIQAAGLKKVVLVSHAGGTAGSLELLRAKPALVRAGVIIDSYLYPQPVLNDPSSMFGTFYGRMIDTLRSPKAAQAFRQWYTGYFDPSCGRATIKAIVDEAAKVDKAVKVAEIEGLLVDTAETARGIKQPVLWLMGSLLSEAQNQAYISSKLKNVGFAQVYGSAHFPQFEQPGQTNAMIEAFLERL